MYDICYISANPGFLFDCLLNAITNTHKTYVIIFKETLPGGSWRISEDSNHYSSNHFFCTNNPEKIINFNKKNEILTNMKLIEIEKSKISIEFSKYKAEYKFYEFVEPLTKWIKTLHKKILNTSNIVVYNCTEVVKITNNDNTNTIHMVRNDKIEEISSKYIYLGQNTYIKQYEFEHKIYNMEKKVHYNKHVFFLINTELYHEIIINTQKSNSFLIVQNLSKYFNYKNSSLVVIRYRNHTEYHPEHKIESYLHMITGKEVKVIENLKTIIKSTVSHENIDLIKDKLPNCNIIFYSADNSIMDDIILKNL